MKITLFLFLSLVLTGATIAGYCIGYSRGINNGREAAISAMTGSGPRVLGGKVILYKRNLPPPSPKPNE